MSALVDVYNVEYRERERHTRAVEVEILLLRGLSVYYITRYTFYFLVQIRISSSQVITPYSFFDKSFILDSPKAASPVCHNFGSLQCESSILLACRLLFCLDIEVLTAFTKKCLTKKDI